MLAAFVQAIKYTVSRSHGSKFLFRNHGDSDEPVLIVTWFSMYLVFE